MDATSSSAGGSADRSAGGSGSAACDASPDTYNLASAFGKAVRDFIYRQTPKYQGRYYGLDYGFDITRETVTGDTGQVTASYHGSAYAQATGKRVSRDGTAKAAFQWSGCGWVVTDFEY